MKQAYIFTSGDQLKPGFLWYIDYYKSLEDAQKHCGPGWKVCLYCNFEWRY